MRRKLFTFFALVSFVMCAATVAMWGRSYSRMSAIFIHFDHFTIATVVRPGRIDFAQYDPFLLATTRWRAFDEPFPISGSGGRAELMEYFFFNWQHAVSLPFWLITAVELLPLAIWIIHRLRRDRSPQGCLSCGYNLTGNTSGVCPECGTAVTRKAEA